MLNHGTIALHYLMYSIALNQTIGHVNQTSFPLPKPSPLLRQYARDPQSGRGFFVLRGLQPDKYNIEDNIIIHSGVSSYIGSIRGRQDSKLIDGVKHSQLLNHIKDLSHTSVANQIGAPVYTTDKQVFHTDAVYNELAATRPDIIRALSENWDFDGYGNLQQPYTSRPLLFHTPATETSPERVIIQYARRGFIGFLHLPRSKNIPSITEAQAEALDALYFLADRYSLTLDLQKGDIQYVNNLSIFYARGGFTDAARRERHLLRLWLRDPELAWETPEPLKERWDGLYKDVTEEEQVFPLEPRIRGGSGKA
ncbi:Satratoxin biosynthesis SC3 cluster 17 [Hyphodiscus hymeniophilus]|uniref:Satratoxin biosynthesis SC3 cluster 17 n=1 Tax=Hyphodiscus hymeniophilus TaxID=353542 RepID=A0A9P6VG39_9HELO|nr:Satratoxin biosynthesis SC3 cluster 17 [Hyphodiscus hymeniophilus]